MPSNYNTRPNKHVDRELFAELVGLVTSGQSADRCGYISMGGPQMSDHQTIYKRTGIEKLYSFDFDQQVVERQRFNAPTRSTVCEYHDTAELALRLDQVTQDLDFDRVIVWLDYTGIGNRSVQLSEFQAVLGKLKPGDIARISLDASPPSAKLKQQLPEALRADHLAAMTELLRQEMGDYHPQDFVFASQNDITSLLVSTIERSCIRATDASHERSLRFQPILLTAYADTSPMVTATVIVQDPAGAPAPPAGFQFLSTDWSTIENLEIPELSIRERTFIDTRLDESEADITSDFGYRIANEPKQARQWVSFKRFHRYLPQFQHVELR